MSSPAVTSNRVMFTIWNWFITDGTAIGEFRRRHGVTSVRAGTVMGGAPGVTTDAFVRDMLRETGREFLEARVKLEYVAAEADREPQRLDRALWSDIADMGWIGVSAPEADGGSGLSIGEEMLLFEEFGRALYPGPYFSNVCPGIAMPPGPRGGSAKADRRTRMLRPGVVGAGRAGPPCRSCRDALRSDPPRRRRVAPVRVEGGRRRCVASATR